MGIDDLARANTKEAKDNSIRSFMSVLREEGVRYDYVKENTLRETAAQSIMALLDKFGMHRAFNEGQGEKPLARHSVTQYFRQSKNWLLNEHPQLQIVVRATYTN